MMYLEKLRTRSRAAVLMSAIAILSIMTILIMSLAFSQGVAQNQFRHSQDRARMTNVSRIALQHAAHRVSASPVLVQQDSGALDLNLNGIQAEYSILPVAATDAIYSSGFLQNREGDVLVAVHVKSRTQSIDRKFLLNTKEGSARNILLSTK